MTNYGVILKKIRNEKNISLRQAAKLINRGLGWLSEVENNKPRAKITQKEFDRIIKAYGGDNDIRKHQLQINASKRSNECRAWYEGAILKHLRKRSGLDLKAAAKLIGISLGYLSNLENSHKPIDTELRKKILCAYGYKKSSYRNYTNKKSRLSSISVESRMRSLINNLNTEKLEMVFQYASELVTSA